MGNRIELVFPSEEYKNQILECVEEFRQNGENKIPGSEEIEDTKVFEDWIKRVKDSRNKEKCEKEGNVQILQFLAIRKEDNKLIGFIQIRTRLNKKLFKRGGHIGNAVRPSERCKGYSTEMIGIALKKARELGIRNVLMTCTKNNIASAKTIKKNGGILEKEFNDSGDIVQRYWITLKKRYADARNLVHNIIDKEYINLRVDNEEFRGNISLLKFNKVKEKWYVDEENRCILANDFKWLEIYPDGANFCIIVIYDENGNITEWYFDIARKIGEDDGIPYEDDLYLDVVVVPDGRIHLLDEEELKAAYKRYEVSEEEYNMAHRVANELMEKYKEKENIDKLRDFSDRYLEYLSKKINS